MAGKSKKRIDYAGWPVDMFFNDIRIDMLLDAQGWTGFGVYFFLAQMASGTEGYYYEWSYALCASTARKMGGGIGSNTVKEAVGYCLQIGLFDGRLFDRWGVLTSKDIQEKFLTVIKDNNRRRTEIYKEYWLLEKNSEDYNGVIFVSRKEELGANVDLLGANDHTLGANDHLQPQNRIEGNKNGIEEKGRELKGIPAPAQAREPKKTQADLFAMLSPGYQISDFLSDKLREWFEYKSEKRQPYKQKGMETLLKKASEMAQKYGDIKVCDLIDSSMESNYAGIFWDRLQKQDKKPTSIADLWEGI